jgi:hypothetical protein
MPLLSTPFDEENPDYSPDGKRLTFGSTRSGVQEIWIANADGSSAVQMTYIAREGGFCARSLPRGRDCSEAHLPSEASLIRYLAKTYVECFLRTDFHSLVFGRHKESPCSSDWKLSWTDSPSGFDDDYGSVAHAAAGPRSVVVGRHNHRRGCAFLVIAG